MYGSLANHQVFFMTIVNHYLNKIREHFKHPGNVRINPLDNNSLIFIFKSRQGQNPGGSSEKRSGHTRIYPAFMTSVGVPVRLLANELRKDPINLIRIILAEGNRQS